MKLVWSNLRKDNDTVIRLKRYTHDSKDAGFMWVGKVYLAHDKTYWVGQLHRTGDSQSFETKAEAMAWVEVVVRMEGR